MWPFKDKPKAQPLAPLAPDVELDIENLPIAFIERRSGETYIEFQPPNEKYRHIECTDEQHNAFVVRFRKKLKLIP